MEKFTEAFQKEQLSIIENALYLTADYLSARANYNIQKELVDEGWDITMRVMVESLKDAKTLAVASLFKANVLLEEMGRPRLIEDPTSTKQMVELINKFVLSPVNSEEGI